MKYGLRLVQILLAVLLMPSVAASAQNGALNSEGPVDCADPARYTFSWNIYKDCGFTPRGGTSTGAPVTLDPDPHPGWLALQQSGLDKKEKDRRAILAMAGHYRTSFEFIETVGYTADYERSRPYQSWGTEMIMVLEDSPNFISLQHLMVMFIQNEDGSLVGPIVQKHWRQDWSFEAPSVMAFTGFDTWQHQPVSEEHLSGSWAQSVYQVDDSPRYEAAGHWQHLPNLSTWISEETWRPIPRRESSVREDYQVLIGTNRHTIVPNGWVHEEENYKVQLEDSGSIAEGNAYLSKELGVNRYERIIDFDFSAGVDYWELTGPVWADIRAVWNDVFSAGDQVHIIERAEGVPLFAVLFQAAEELGQAEDYDSVAIRQQIEALLEPYITQ